jgi:hypothetical protein
MLKLNTLARPISDEVCSLFIRWFSGEVAEDYLKRMRIPPNEKWVV